MKKEYSKPKLERHGKLEQQTQATYTPKPGSDVGSSS